MSDENKIRDAADAIKGLVGAVPIYQDVVQPAAQEVGKGFQTISKTIHVALAPVSALVWGYEQIKDFVSTTVAKKLENIPQEKIITPKPNVAGPTLEALRYTGHEEVLRDLYANLLASSMNSDTASGAHPAFVEIIRQLTPDEAKIIRILALLEASPLINLRREEKVGNNSPGAGYDFLENFSILGIQARCEYLDLVPTYIDNLCRLGLCTIPPNVYLTASGIYEPLENHEDIVSIIKKYETENIFIVRIVRKALFVTTMGKQFMRVCVKFI